MKVGMINPLSGSEVSPEDPWLMSCQVSRNLVGRLRHKERASVRVQSAFGRSVEEANNDNDTGQEVGKGQIMPELACQARVWWFHSGVQELGTNERSGVTWSQWCFWKTTESSGRLGQAHFWLSICTYLSMEGGIWDLNNHIRVFQHNPRHLDYRMPFPWKLLRSSQSWLVFIESVLPPIFPTDSRAQALPSTTQQKLLLPNELHIANLETQCNR